MLEIMRWLIPLPLVILLGCDAALEEQLGTGTTEILPRVAHAGGGLEQQTYNNSLEAVEHSLALGFRWIELDFVWTSDDHLVTFHDWKFQARRAFGFALKDAPDLASFRRLMSEHGTQTHMDLTQLAELMRRHPDWVLVTDVKARNLEALKRMVELLPDAENRVIPQIYQPDEYRAVRELGYQQVIWTLYQYAGDSAAVIAHTERMALVAITLSVQRAQSGLALALAQRGIRTYVHTINDEGQWTLLRDNWGVDSIYTDFMPAVPE